ncbi:hypothetical protein ES705_26476 [subsurface metagenome]
MPMSKLNLLNQRNKSSVTLLFKVTGHACGYISYNIFKNSMILPSCHCFLTGAGVIISQ